LYQKLEAGATVKGGASSPPTRGWGFRAAHFYEWYAKFEENNLALLYQEHKASGEESTFFKLISGDKAEERGH
jgi:hypothetical protein